jgi:hypothetical protein
MTQLLDIPHTDFAQDGRSPQPIRHHLAEHELLSVEAVAALADRLPASTVEHALAKGIGVVVPGGATTLDASPGEVARGIESNGCWMVLKHIEQDPEFKRLLDETLDEVAPLVSDREGGMHHREGFIFLSAPNSVTPSHIDPEHNFLLQIRGWKEMHVGSFGDAKAEQELLERYYSGGHRNLDWKPEEATTYRLDPGHGVYVPVHAPHFVRNGDGVSVSLSITWYTPAVERAARVHALNSRLRRLGISPAAPGKRAASDQAKAGAVKAISAAKRTVKARRAA